MPVTPLTPQTVIDQIITSYDGVDPSDADNVNRRARLLLALQHIYDYVWLYREWEWTFCETDLTVSPAMNYAPLPTDPASPPTWLEFGRNGGLWSSDGRRWTEVSRYTLEQYRRRGGTAADVGIFTIFGGYIQLPAASSSGMTLTAFHRFGPEILVDGDPPVPPLPSYEFVMPARFINTVLIPGLIFKAQETKNDARDTWGGQFRDGLAQMCEIENPMKTRTHRLPMAVRGAW